MSDLGQRVVEQARSYRGVIFQHAGRNRHGLDCAGLIAVVAHDLGITAWDDVNYQREFDPAYLTRVLLRFADPTWEWGHPNGLAELAVQPGDLLQFVLCGHPRHVGIAATDERGERTVIHCYQSVGKVVEQPFSRYWQGQLWAAYRFREQD